VAPGLIGQLPSHDRRLIRIPLHKRLDIILKRSLDIRVRIEITMSLSTTQDLRDVYIHAPIVAPVIDERNDETDPRGFGLCDDCVEFTETVGTSVDGGCTVGPELVVGSVGLNARHIVESPGADDGCTSLCNFAKGLGDKGGRAQLSEPICIGASDSHESVNKHKRCTGLLTRQHYK
jgi:hypothetical protein